MIDYGDICPICGWTKRHRQDKKDIEEAKEKYKKIHVSSEYMIDYVRFPRGIELPGLYESDNIEATQDKQYLYTKECIENDKFLFGVAKHVILDDLSEELKKYNEISNEEVFNIFNALAYKDDKLGLLSTFYLAICYVLGCGCKKDIFEAINVLGKITDYYEVRTSKNKQII